MLYAEDDVASGATRHGHGHLELEEAVNAALRGEFAALGSMLKSDCRWSNPVASGVGSESLCELLNETGSFFEAPVFHVMGGDESQVEWRASGSWPVPWRPRAVVSGSSRLVINEMGLIASIEDAWQETPFNVFTRQVLPRLRDMLDFYMTPPAELALEERMRYTLPRGFRVLRCPPVVCLRASLIDATNSRSMRLASALPFFPFVTNFRAATKATALYATSPLEVRVEVVSIEPEVLRRVTWDIPVPSLFRLENLPHLDAPAPDRSYVDAGFAAEPELSYVERPARYLLVADFDGDVQDQAAEKTRRQLIRVATEAGLHPISMNSRPPIIHRQFDTKLVFNEAGHLALAAYLPPIPLLPIDRNQLAIALEPPTHFDADHDGPRQLGRG